MRRCYSSQKSIQGHTVREQPNLLSKKGRLVFNLYHERQQLKNLSTQIILLKTFFILEEQTTI
jgi:hypothetical protein